MVKYHTLRRRRPSIQLSAPIAAILLILFLGYVVGSYYLITRKDNQLERHRRTQIEQKQKLVAANEKIDQQVREFDRERQELNRTIADLRERLKILDVIKDFSEGAMADDEQLGLASVIYDESRRFGYDPLMILAIIVTESHFRPDARSKVGATGLMQVMPFVGKDLAEQVTTKSPDLWADDRPIEWTGRETLLDPVQNVRLGMLHLCQLIIKFRSVRDGIRAYNFGPTSLKDRISKGRLLPKRYMQRVLGRYDEFKEKYGPRPEILKSAESASLVASASVETVQEPLPQSVFDTNSIEPELDASMAPLSASAVVQAR